MLSVAAMHEGMVALTYLVRYLDDPGGTRRRQLVGVIRTRFDRLYRTEQEFLTEHWPGCEPGGPDPGALVNPSPTPFVAWARDPLFGPVY
jgi:hypothetical protein